MPKVCFLSTYSVSWSFIGLGFFNLLSLLCRAVFCPCRVSVCGPSRHPPLHLKYHRPDLDGLC
jgi:hypothetical protein